METPSVRKAAPKTEDGAAERAQLDDNGDYKVSFEMVKVTIDIMIIDLMAN